MVQYLVYSAILLPAVPRKTTLHLAAVECDIQNDRAKNKRSYGRTVAIPIYLCLTRARDAAIFHALQSHDHHWPRLHMRM
jgi:hypothetical protein